MNALKKILLAAVLGAVVVVLMLWLAGTFHRKVPAVAAAESPRPVGSTKLVEVVRKEVAVTETAVGTIRPVYESAVASKVMEKVQAITVGAGTKVKKDEVLVRLEATMLQARLEQSQGALAAATAGRNQAQIEFDAMTKALAKNAATQLELDRASNALKSAQAAMEQAQQAVTEARTGLDYTVIRSPMDGVVIDKKVNVGDTVVPGQVVVTLYDPTRMQLVASVRESLAQHLKVGQKIDGCIDSLNKNCSGTISEIVPESLTASRTFSVKVTGPCQPGVYTGTFGRLLIPLGSEQVLEIPKTAVQRVGQLDIVDVAEGGYLRRRAVQLGKTLEKDVQVLSGLREGEQVVRSAQGGL